MASAAEDDSFKDPLPDILEKIGLGHLAKTFEENLVTINEVNAMTELDFTKVGVNAIGMRIRIKQAVEDFKRANGCNTSAAVAKYLELQQRKKTKTVKSLTCKKLTRRVRVGWKHLVKPGKYKVMTLKEGGGQQILDLDKEISLNEATKQIVDIYFPSGRLKMKIYQTVHNGLTERQLKERFRLKYKEQVQDTSQEDSSRMSPLRWKTIEKQKFNLLYFKEDDRNLYDAVDKVLLSRLILTAPYLDLIVVSSSSEDDEPVEEISADPPLREVNLYEILSGLKTSINTQKSTKFNVTRRSPIEGCRRALRRTDFNPENSVSAKFADDYGQAEGAVDEGGPMRELFRLVLKEMRDSVAFTGEETARIISLNAKALREGLYKDIGVLMAMAIGHGDQWPCYFHPVSYKSFAVGMVQASPRIEDISDIDIRHQILKLQRSTSMEELQDCVDANYALFSISGCLPPLREFSIELRDQLVNDILNFIVVGKNVPAINQFMEGLSALGIGQLVRKYPEQFKEVFCFTEKKITADAIEAVFQKVNNSDICTNRRSMEEKTMSYWCDYLMDIEDGKAEITLKELLSFGTGTDMIPYLGFPTDPAIEFSHIQRYHMANTCAMILKLPVHGDFEAFKEYMDFGIRNSPGFGLA